MTDKHPITPPPPHLLKKFSAQAQDEAKKRNGAGYLKTFATLCIEWAVNSETTSNDRQIRSSEIEPPSELVYQWRDSGGGFDDVDFATQAARWGADQELEACCEHLKRIWAPSDTIDSLRAARRPKPPSLKEQAKLAAAVLRSPDETCSIAELQQHWHTICKALEQLND